MPWKKLVRGERGEKMFLFIRRNACLRLLIIHQQASSGTRSDVPVMSLSQEIPALQFKQKEYLQVFLKFESLADGRWFCGPGTDLCGISVTHLPLSSREVGWRWGVTQDEGDDDSLSEGSTSEQQDELQEESEMSEKKSCSSSPHPKWDIHITASRQTEKKKRTSRWLFHFLMMRINLLHQRYPF